MHHFLSHLLLVDERLVAKRQEHGFMHLQELFKSQHTYRQNQDHKLQSITKECVSMVLSVPLFIWQGHDSIPDNCR